MQAVIHLSWSTKVTSITSPSSNHMPDPSPCFVLGPCNLPIKPCLQGLYKFQKGFLSMAQYDIIKGGILFMGTSPGRACAHINQSESKSTPINVIYSGYGRRWQRCTGLAGEGFVILFLIHEINNIK